MATNILGVDIGSYAVKVITLSGVSGSQSVLRGLGMAQYPLAPTFEEQHSSAPSAFGDTIKSLVDSLHVPGKDVVASISGEGCSIKIITLPVMPADDLREAVIDEAERHISLQTDKMSLSCHVMDPASNTGSMTVLLAAANTEIVSARAEALAAARLRPVIIDLDGLAICNAYDFAHPGNLDDIVLMNIGAKMMNIVALHKGMPLIATDERGGGHYLTAELAKSLNISFEEAEAAKFGSRQVSDPALATASVEHTVCEWIAVAAKVIEDAKAKVFTYKPKKILLSGGSALLPGLAAYFQKHLRLDAGIFNPLLNLAYNTKKYDVDYIKSIGPQMAVSLGLALRKVEEG